METVFQILVRKIVYAKLPTVVQKALIEKVSSNYPTLDHIFNNIKDIIEKLVKTKSKKVENLKKTDNSKTDSNKNSKSNKFSPNHKPALENFATGIDRGNKVFHCKFCDSDGHSSFYCSQYKTREQRLDRCKILRLCFKCTSNKHLTDTCPGKKGGLYHACKCCKSKGHVSAM